jgi:phenylpropionate dioxygenase-like ring-hydroxylating dioxygenase large terminal subunit
MRAETFVTNAWYGAGLSVDFPVRDLQSRAIAGKPIVLWRDDDGTVVAFDDRCVHKRMALSAGRMLDNGTLECAYHGLCYDSSGTCVKIPSQPDQPISTKAKLKPHPLVEQDGIVWVWPGNPDKIGNCRPPRTPEIDSDDWVTVSSDRLPVGANYRLLIENLLDITHFYPLHDGNIGDYENSQIPVELVEEVIDGNASIMSVREVENYAQPPMLVDWLGYETVDRRHTHQMVNPGLTRVEMRVAPPGELGGDKDRSYVLYHTHTPINETNLEWRWIVNTPAGQNLASDPSKPTAVRFGETFPTVAEEDRWALEKQQEMYDFDDDGYQELLLKTDRSVVIVRSILNGLEAEEGEVAAE